MAKFIIEPHFRLQEWVAEEKGYFKAEGLDYEFRELVQATDGKIHDKGVHILTGFLSGLFGLGGGFLLVPALAFLGWPMKSAIGTSLFYVSLIGVSATIQHLRAGNVDKRFVAVFAATAVALAPGTRRLGAGGHGAAERTEAAYPEPPPGVHMPGPSPWPFFAPIAMAVDTRSDWVRRATTAPTARPIMPTTR